MICSESYENTFKCHTYNTVDSFFPDTVYVVTGDWKCPFVYDRKSKNFPFSDRLKYLCACACVFVCILI